MSVNDRPKLSLAEHAELSAVLAEGTRDQREVLAERQLTESDWNEVTAFWMQLIAQETAEQGTSATLALAYSDAFAKAQDALKPIVPMTPEEWATMTVEIQNAGPTRPLAVRNLSNADYIRLARHFANRLSSNPEDHERYWQTYLALNGAQS